MVFGYFIPFLFIWGFVFWHSGSLCRRDSKQISRCHICIGFGKLSLGATKLLLIPLSFWVSNSALIPATRNNWKTVLKCWTHSTGVRSHVPAYLLPEKSFCDQRQPWAWTPWPSANVGLLLIPERRNLVWSLTSQSTSGEALHPTQPMPKPMPSTQHLMT